MKTKANIVISGVIAMSMTLVAQAQGQGQGGNTNLTTNRLVQWFQTLYTTGAKDCVDDLSYCMFGTTGTIGSGNSSAATDMIEMIYAIRAQSVINAKDPNGAGSSSPYAACIDNFQTCLISKGQQVKW